MSTRSVVVKHTSQLFSPGVEVDGRLYLFEPTHFYRANLQAVAFAMLAEAFSDEGLIEAGVLPTKLLPGEFIVDDFSRARCLPPPVVQPTGVDFQI
jgi:hypothetical protein